MPPVRADGPNDVNWTSSQVAEYGDWSSACDDAGQCTAVSVSRAYVKRAAGTDPGDYAVPKLWVIRRAGPDEPPRVFVDTSVWGEAKSIGKLSLHIDYDCDGICTGRAYAMSQVAPGRYEIAPQQVTAFFAESTKSRRAATRLSDGSMHGVITTDGLTAAMHFVDQNQGRQRTVGALFSKGQKPDSTVPLEKARQTFNALRGVEASTTGFHPYAELQQKWRAYCEGDIGRGEPSTEKFTLTNGQQLWSIDCSTNPHSEKRLWLIESSDGRFHDHQFPRPDVGREPDQKRGRQVEPPVQPNSNFDPVAGLITSYSGGMCGWRRRWGWTGTSFEMLDSMEMPACIDILPQDWLVTYRAVPE